MIRRLKIKGYKSLRDVEVDLRMLTVVFGPNAAGKSNLLDALSLLGRMVTKGTLDEAFETHRGAPLEAFSFDSRGLPGLQETHHADFTIEVDVSLSDAVVDSVERRIRQAREGLEQGESVSPRRRMVRERLLRYRVTVRVMTSSGHLRVMDEYLCALSKHGSVKESRKPFIELTPDGQRLIVRMERQGRPAFESLGQDRTVASKPLYPPHHPHLVAFKEELSRWRFYFLSPPAMRDEVPVQHVETLSPSGVDIAAFLNTMRAEEERRYRSLGKTLSAVVPGLEKVDAQPTDEGLVRLTVEERGMPLSARLISEGTLRVLGLLAITNPLEPMSVVGYEEPENGVHPSRLSMVARLIETAAARGSTQFVLNTHSPVLPEYFQYNPEALLVRAWKDGRDTKFEPFESSGRLWAEADIEAALDEEPSRLRDRLIRGDYS